MTQWLLENNLQNKCKRNKLYSISLHIPYTWSLSCFDVFDRKTPENYLYIIILYYVNDTWSPSVSDRNYLIKR